MQLSLKYLFGLTGFFAVVAWCAAQVGFDNPLYWFVVVVVLALSAFFVWTASKRSWLLSLLAVPILVVLCSPVLASLTLGVQSLLLLVVGIVCAFRSPPKLETRVALALICASLALVAGVWPGIAARRQLESMRQEFPIRSHKKRLNYERKGKQATVKATPHLSPEVSTRLSAMEDFVEPHSLSMRDSHLRRIHSQTYENFVRATGFGVGRMMRPRSKSMRRPPLQDIPFDADPYINEQHDRPDWQAARYAGTSADVEHLHKVSQFDFFDPDSFGVVLEPVEKVVGFVEHAFHYSPLRGMEQSEQWTIDQLELVSLLKFDQPRVYILDHLPRMDQLADGDVPTRPLDAFESGALKQLWTQKDVVVSSQDNNYRMLGSLRAANRCLECHNVGRGALLGAFTYALRRAVTASTTSELP